jgi:hypothetical protein
MSQDDVERLLGRLITDETFRKLAADSLAAACIQNGFQLSATELELLSDLDMEWLMEFSRRIDPGLSRAVTKPPDIQSRNPHLHDGF